MTDKVRNARGVDAVSQGSGWRYEIDIGGASEGDVQIGFSRIADADECVVSWAVRCKSSSRARSTENIKQEC